MLSLVDIIVLGLILLLIINGWSKGFIRALIKPAAFILSIALAFFHYRKTQNIIASSCIGFLGPIILGWGFSLLLSMTRMTFDSPNSPSGFSRILGGLFNMVWGGAFIALFFLLLTFLPDNFPLFPNWQKSIQNSYTYQWVDRLSRDKDQLVAAIQTNWNILQNPAQLESMADTPEFQELIKEPKIQEILSDQEIVNKFENKGVAGLLSDPKILALMEDKELLQKFLNVYQKMMTKVAEDKKTKPKIYEVNGVE